MWSRRHRRDLVRWRAFSKVPQEPLFSSPLAEKPARLPHRHTYDCCICNIAICRGRVFMIMASLLCLSDSLPVKTKVEHHTLPTSGANSHSFYAQDTEKLLSLTKTGIFSFLSCTISLWAGHIRTPSRGVRGGAGLQTRSNLGHKAFHWSLGWIYTL